MDTLERRVAKTQRGKRVLNSREPKLQEDVKQMLFLKGPKASETSQQALKDLAAIKRPHTKLLKKKKFNTPV